MSGVAAADALERLVYGVRIGEDVVGGFPIGVLVCGAEARYPKRRRISECSTKIGGSCPIPRCSCERRNDRGRIVTEEALGQCHVIRPALHIAAGEKRWGNSRPARWHRAMRSMGSAPCCPFLSTPRCHHLADHARQHIGCMLPADDVKTLESFIDEIERMSAIGVRAVRLGGKEKICQRRR